MFPAPRFLQFGPRSSASIFYWTCFIGTPSFIPAKPKTFTDGKKISKFSVLELSPF